MNTVSKNTNANPATASPENPPVVFVSPEAQKNPTSVSRSS